MRLGTYSYGLVVEASSLARVKLGWALEMSLIKFR
jgi:hypothetical protein